MQLLSTPSSRLTWQGLGRDYNPTARQVPAGHAAVSRPWAPARLVPSASNKPAPSQVETKEAQQAPLVMHDASWEPAPVDSQSEPAKGPGILSSIGRAAACLAVAAVLCFGNAGTALARSGGRVGGSAFSGGASRGFSSGSSRSGGFSSSRSSSSSSSYSSPSYSYRGPAMRAPTPRMGGSTVIISPGFGPSYSPYTSPYSPYVSPAPVIVSGPSAPVTAGDVAFLGTILVVGVMFWATASALESRRYSGGVGSATGTLEAPVTVTTVQIGALAVAHELKLELDELALQADTSTPRGLHTLLQETVLALLRHPQYCVLGHSSTRVCSGQQAAERAYNEMSLEARAKFDEDTLVNYGGRPMRRTKLTQGGRSVDELLVITLVVAGEGKLALPPVKSQEDLRAVLKALGKLGPSELKAVQLTWTPQASGDSMSQEEVMEVFPDLRPL